MRILWAKAGGILPLDSGGRIRSYHIATELARRHDVTLFTFYAAIDPDPHETLLAPFVKVERMPLDLSERASTADMAAYAANTLTLKPYQMRKYCRPEVARRLRELLQEDRYDALICDFLLAADVVPWDAPIPKVIFTHNVEAAIWRRHMEVATNPLWKALAWREYRAWERAERRYTGMADHVLTVSDDDRRAFLSFLPAERLTTIPTGVDLEFFRPDRSAPDSSSIVFTGAMEWLPNEDAIVFFASEILPLIQQQIPGVTLWVVGRKPTRKVIAIGERNPAIRVTGAVDDIRPHVHRAAAYVVPLRIGGGTRIKIFEAMGMGMPIVSTTVGAEGLPVTHEQDILLADAPEDFARQTVRLLRDAELNDRLGRAARALVESQYSWAAVTNVLVRVLEGLATPGPARSGNDNAPAGRTRGHRGT